MFSDSQLNMIHLARVLQLNMQYSCSLQMILCGGCFWCVRCFCGELRIIWKMSKTSKRWVCLFDWGGCPFLLNISDHLGWQFEFINLLKYSIQHQAVTSLFFVFFIPTVLKQQKIYYKTIINPFIYLQDASMNSIYTVKQCSSFFTRLVLSLCAKRESGTPAR